MPSSPRVIFYAPSTGTANGHLIDSIIPALSGVCEVLLVTPAHFKGCAGHQPAIQFSSAASKWGRAARELNFLRAYRLYRKLKAWQPTVAHLLNGEGYPWTIYLAYLLRRDGIPVLLTVHDTTAHPGTHAAAALDTLTVALRSVTYRFTSALHLFSKTCREELPPAAKSLPAFYLPHWTTEEQFLMHRQPGIERQPNQVLFFGRIQPYKGLHTLVKATILLGGAFRTVIAGSGKLDEESARLIAEHPAWFTLHNRYVPDAEIAVLLQRSAVCALPYTHVTQSSVPMIAAAFGVPVVASRLGSFVEDITPGNGCLVPPEDPAAFAAAVVEAVKKTPAPLLDRAIPAAAAQLREIYLRVAGSEKTQVAATTGSGQPAPPSSVSLDLEKTV